MESDPKKILDILKKEFSGAKIKTTGSSGNDPVSYNFEIEGKPLSVVNETLITKIDGKFKSIGLINFKDKNIDYKTAQQANDAGNFLQEALEPVEEGKWQIIKDIVRFEKVKGCDHLMECGYIKLVSPSEETTKYKYKSGPAGKGPIPFKEEYELESVEFEDFTANGCKDERPGLRIKDSNFTADNRGGFLFHENIGGLGTFGCIGIQSKDWGRFVRDLGRIPIDQRPTITKSAKDDKKEFSFNNINIEESLVKALQDGLATNTEAANIAPQDFRDLNSTHLTGIV